MAFSGYLIQIGRGANSYVIPLRFMKYETYKVTYNTLDQDPYRDSEGILHRNVLAHKVGKVEFNTRALSSTDMEDLLSHIRALYINEIEQRVLVTFYEPKSAGYVTQEMYMPDIDFTIRDVDEDKQILKYTETRIAFIGY